MILELPRMILSTSRDDYPKKLVKGRQELVTNR